MAQAKAILEGGLSIGGKALREIYEVNNHAKAVVYVNRCAAEGKPPDESIIKDSTHDL